MMLNIRILGVYSFYTVNQLTRRSGFYKRPQLITNKNGSNIKDKIINFSKSNPTDFGKLRTELLLNIKNITEVNVDYFIVSMFDTADDLKFIEGYIKYLKSKNLDVNSSTLGRLLKLYNLSFQNGSLTESDEKEILNIFQEISNKHDNLDATTCENLIFGLVCTPEWKKCLDLLKVIKISATPSNKVYSLIISRSFEQDSDHELAWELLTEMVKIYKKQPNCSIFISLLKSVQTQIDYAKQIEKLNRLLNFLGKFDIFISKLVANELIKTLDCMNLKNAETHISVTGKCSNCSLFLERIFITNCEFKKMRSAFLDRVLIRKDIFVKSNPKELEKFLNYIDKHAPFHCVVDGLNVAYSMNGKLSADVLCSVVRYFKDLNMNILIIGRKHMSRWPTENLTFIKKNSRLFLTDNLSQDDPFLLYAALKSGPSTHIFSRDLMRSHSYLIGDDLRVIFKRWLQEHLYSLITVKRDGKILVKEPNKYNINAHKVEDNWHIPYVDVYQSNPKDSNETIMNWLCITIPKLS